MELVFISFIRISVSFILHDSVSVIMVGHISRNFRYCAAIFIPILASLLFLNGCASITHGTTQKIPIESDPTGASIAVDGGEEKYKTPCELELTRGVDHRLKISADGYESETVNISHSVSAVMAGNGVFGGLIGIIVDTNNGAAFKLEPENVRVRLKPMPVVNSAEKHEVQETIISPEPIYITEIRSKRSISAKIRAAAELFNQGSITREERNNLQSLILKGEI